jgi:hypothetical protein
LCFSVVLLWYWHDMKNITWLQSEKRGLQVYSQALDALRQGDRQAAECSIQMSGLSDEQLFNGLVARLKSAYSTFRGYGPRRKVGQRLIKQAHDALVAAGVKDVISWE